MSLPLLPGNNFNRNLGKEKYHKSHYFDHVNQTAYLFGDNKAGIGGDPFPGRRVDPSNSYLPPGEGSKTPAWVAFDKQVLSFDAYYQEGVTERREEQYRTRYCKIYFYLEDDSVQVIEARLKNSGLPQGTLIRRHRIPKPAPNDDKFYTVEDFNVGINIMFYGKTFRITECDQFTENFLRKLGVRVLQPEGQPNDPYTSHRKALDESMQPLRPYERHDSLRQFLDHDRHVLRFYCFWDDTDSLYGDSREMVLHYFLSDDTVEIREVITANCGRDSAPCFLKRQKLPKDLTPLNKPGEVCDRTVLNVFGQIQNGRYILDNLKTGTVKTEFYSDRDLSIGSFINVYGRKFLLSDCDDFTKEYYRTKYGISDFKSISQTGGKTSVTFKSDVPPYNGYGSEEDSLGNTKGLVPQPPRRDITKLLEKDRLGLESNVLRFKSRMVTDKAIDKDRIFIVNFYLSDDTVLVYEPPQRNSGFVGGKFLERRKIPKPGHQQFSVDLPEYLQASDFYVGALLEINKFQMELIDADEYAYRYMEKHSEFFPVSDAALLIKKLRQSCAGRKQEMQAAFASFDTNACGAVPYNVFRAHVAQLSCGQFTEHELITLGRYFALRAPEELDINKIMSSVQAHLRKHNFEFFNRLVEAAQHRDADGSGLLEPNSLVTVFRTLQVPLPLDLLRTALQVLAVDESGRVDYTDLVNRVNWRDRPLPPLPESPQHSGTAEGSWPTNTVGSVQLVRYEDFMRDVFD